MDFCQGEKSLPLTCGPFFKKIFHPDVHQDHLSKFVSSILGEKVRAVRILPTDDSVLDGGSLLIMDLLGGVGGRIAYKCGDPEAGVCLPWVTAG